MTAFSTQLLMVLQFFVPASLVAWLAFSREPSLVHYVVLAIGVTAFVAYAWIASRWDIVGLFLRPLLLLSLGAALVVGAVRHAAGPLASASQPADIARLCVHLAVGAVFLTLLGAAWSARFPPGPTVDLVFPLHREPWYVAQGGAGRILNHHYGAGAQDYALDVVVVDAWGRRADGLLPSDLARYRAFDRSVVAPCSGRIVARVDELPDYLPPRRDSDHPAGNFVAIACDRQPATVLLAHLRRGSVLAEIGTHVEAGSPVGRIGNSGNTSEPHLHLHAVVGHEADLRRLLVTGEPLPMRFDGQALARNDVGSRWRSPAAPSGG